MANRCNSPVLFLVFCRPEATERVFARIRSARPRRLYIACDGARPGREEEKRQVERVRSISTQVDWDCEINTLFRDSNLGCGRAVSEAITWFFEREQEGIILEDDCLPSNSFFPFCDELLERFRDDDRIAAVTGSNPFPTKIPPIDDSYFLARYGRIWGWASWRRAWQGYDLNISFWPKMKRMQSHSCFFEHPKHAEHYERIWDRVYAKEIDTWDYQWDLKRLAELRFTIVSTINQIENIGFNSVSTHTKTPPLRTLMPAAEIPFPLVHPDPLLLDFRRDRESHGLRYQTFPFRIRRKLERLKSLFLRTG